MNGLFFDRGLHNFALGHCIREGSTFKKGEDGIPIFLVILNIYNCEVNGVIITPVILLHQKNVNSENFEI